MFEKHRATPGAPFDESHFLDFFLVSPKGKRVIYNSFGGLRRFNAFLDETQLELGVCFSIKDRDANYPLDKFVARALELQQSRRGSLKSLNNQIHDGPGWSALVTADIVLLAITAFARENVSALAAIGVIAIAINVSFILFAWKARSYLLKLRTRIESN